MLVRAHPAIFCEPSSFFLTKIDPIMSLIKWNRPLMPTANFSKFIENFFGDEDFMGSFLKGRMELPAVNISEDGKFFKMELAVPGMKKEDFKVEVENGVMTVWAEKKEEMKEEDKNFTRQEFSYQSFERCFRLPDNVNPDKIEAHYENGILEMMLPKLKEEKISKAKKIKIV